jgi:hypothetical protein
MPAMRATLPDLTIVAPCHGRRLFSSGARSIYRIRIFRNNALSTLATSAIKVRFLEFLSGSAAPRPVRVGNRSFHIRIPR